MTRTFLAPRRAVAVIALVLPIAATGLAQAAPEDSCAKSYETAQELRADGLLRAARDVLRSCVRPSCQAFIRDDCARWLDEVELAMPSAVFVVRMGGKVVDDVTVICDEEPLTEKVDGRAMTIDPGKHTCRFEAASATPGRIDVLIIEGQKNRVIEVDLRPRVAPLPPVKAPAPAAPAVSRPQVRVSAPAAIRLPARREQPGLPPAEQEFRKSLAIAFGATAVAGVGTFAVLGLRGLAEERNLAGSCAPICERRDIGAIRTTYLLADIGLGIGLVSAALAGYLVISDRASEAAGPSAAAGASISAVPLGGGGFLSLQSLF
jgi:hypothetical protein